VSVQNCSLTRSSFNAFCIELTHRHGRARRLGGCRGDRPGNGLSRAASSRLCLARRWMPSRLRSTNFRTAIVFQLPSPHIIEHKQAAACSGAAQKSATYQSLRSHSGSRDGIGRHNSTGSRGCPIKLHFRPTLNVRFRPRVPNTGASRQEGDSHANALNAAGRVFERCRAGE